MWQPPQKKPIKKHRHTLFITAVTILWVLLLSTYNAEAKIITGKHRITSNNQPSSATYPADRQTNLIANQSLQTEKTDTKQTTELKYSIKNMSAETRSKASVQTHNLDQPTRTRAPQTLHSAHSYRFSIFDASILLHQDEDSDGFYSDFSVYFDADVLSGYADVYAALYISRNGGSWFHYHTTDVFTIYAADALDEYQVRSQLNIDFPPDQYDILIELYKVGIDAVIATLSSEDDNDLHALPLEDQAHEFFHQDFWFNSVTSHLSNDADHDQFYSKIALEFNANTLFLNTSAKARVVIRQVASTWEEIFTTQPFNFDDGQTFQSIDIDFESGFPPGHYDIDIELLDANNTVLALASQEYVALALVPLESSNYDDQFDDGAILDVPPLTDSNGTVATQESGGGSVGWFFLLMLPLMISIKRNQLAKTR